MASVTVQWVDHPSAHLEELVRQDQTVHLERLGSDIGRSPGKTSWKDFERLKRCFILLRWSEVGDEKKVTLKCWRKINKAILLEISSWHDT